MTRTCVIRGRRAPTAGLRRDLVEQNTVSANPVREHRSCRDDVGWRLQPRYLTLRPSPDTVPLSIPSSNQHPEQKILNVLLFSYDSSSLLSPQRCPSIRGRIALNRLRLPHATRSKSGTFLTYGASAFKQEYPTARGEGLRSQCERVARLFIGSLVSTRTQVRAFRTNVHY